MAIFVQINAMARQNDMGREGESEARAYLVKHGYNVLHTNWHWHHYEPVSYTHLTLPTIRLVCVWGG